MNKVLSLFSNVGIGELLLPKQFEVVLANELEAKRCEVYRKLHPGHEILQGDIKELSDIIIKKSNNLGVNIVLATPPCQPFSIVNNKKRKNDARNFLVVQAVNIAKKIGPQMVVMENVTKQGSLIIDQLSYIDWIAKQFPRHYVWEEILDTADFGVPQRRKRLFTFISKKRFVVPHVKKHVMLSEAIGHLPSIEANEPCDDDPMHYGPPNSPHHVEWARHTPTGQSAFSNEGKNSFFPKTIGCDGKMRTIRGYDTTYRRMYWDRVSYTITMNHAGPNGSNTLHPGRKLQDGTYSDARTLTLREISIIMGLPHSFCFPKSVSYRDGVRFLGEGLSPVVVREIFKSWVK